MRVRLLAHPCWRIVSAVFPAAAWAIPSLSAHVPSLSTGQRVANEKVMLCTQLFGVKTPMSTDSPPLKSGCRPKSPMPLAAA
eukprot:gene8594-biopygen106